MPNGPATQHEKRPMKLGVVMSGTNFPVHNLACMAKSPGVFALDAVLSG
jgi:hypothetical protein